jgi:ABC-2 type transport system ATP-binding protein
LADRVAIIVNGRIVADGPPSELGSRTQGTTIISFHLSPHAPRPPASLAGHSSYDHFRIETRDSVRLLRDLTEWALTNDVALEALTVSQPTLEDVYLELADQPTEVSG